jgi:hypothetical protein
VTGALVAADRRADADSLRIVLAWLTRLARATVATSASPVTEARLREMAVMLLATLPSAAFTSDSLAAVLRGMQYFPAVDILKARVVDHWNATKPASAPFLGDRRPVSLSPAVEAKIRAILDPAGECARLRAEASRFASEWSDREALQAAVDRVRGQPMARALGRLLGAAVAKHAPENLGMIPEEWRP